MSNKRRFHACQVYSYQKNAIEMYGGKCDCCGETELVFLALDHRNGNQRIRKGETASQAWRNAIRDNDKNEYRVLCHNCNQAMSRGRTCPHTLKQM